MKRGTPVEFSTRSRTGEGKIAGIRETARGVWYEVKTPDGEIVCVRAVNLRVIS